MSCVELKAAAARSRPAAQRRARRHGSVAPRARSHERDFGVRGAARGRPLRTTKAPPTRGFRECAEEDSNLHPVIPDQALNLVTRVSDPFRSCTGVQNKHRSRRTGRNGRSGCCQGMLPWPRLFSGGRGTRRAPTAAPPRCMESTSGRAADVSGSVACRAKQHSRAGKPRAGLPRREPRRLLVGGAPVVKAGGANAGGGDPTLQPRQCAR